MSPKLLVFFLILGFLALSVQAGGKKHKGHSHDSKDKSNESKDKSNESKDKSNESKDKSNESKDKSNESKDKSNESKSHPSKSNESKSQESKSNESKSEEDCEETPVKPPQKCGRNEEWTNCGTACPLTCDKPKPGICIKKCVVGCQCKKGLLRNKWGKCVEACDC